MLRIILSLCVFMVFAFAESCDFTNKQQKDCELDINNPPIFLHKFVDDNNNISVGYGACVYDGKISINKEDYDVIDCSMTENSIGALTEGVIITNTINFANDVSYKLTTNKYIELKSNNILLRVFGDFILDSGVKINTQNNKKFILEIIESSNGKSNLILQRGARLDADTIIMPNGRDSNIILNTFFGGVYEKDFIDMVNEDEASKRGNMETIINTNNIYSIQKEGEIKSYNGNILCGPETNPLNLNNNEYILKRLFKVKNTSKDFPNESNSICEIDENKCFDGILAYNNVKVYEKNYKIVATKLNILPDYGIFIESGKINLQDNEINLKDALPDANITSQNHGRCGYPIKVAFTQEMIDSYNNSKQDNLEDEKISLAQNEVDEIKESQEEPNANEGKALETKDSKNDPDKIVESEIAESEVIQETVESKTIDDKTKINDIAEENLNQTQEIPTQKAPIQENALDDKEDKTIEAKIDDKKEDEIIQNQDNYKTILDEDPKNDITLQKRGERRDDFLIVEQEIFNNFNKTCNKNTECLYKSLLPYDKVVWTKLSSKNKINSIYVVNFTNDNLDVNCSILNHYGEDSDSSYKLNSNDIIGKIDLKFPLSSEKSTYITCKSNNIEKQTNKINVTPAKFVLNPIFKDSETTQDIKAGLVNIIFEDSNALNLEGDIDNGFNGSLIANSNNLTFKQKNKCSSLNKDVFIKEPMKIVFKEGKALDNNIVFMANTIAKGKLNIDFNIEDNSNLCLKNNENNSQMPQCVSANISKDINIIPANFMIKTDIISPYKVSYYGQIDDRNTFKFNPILNVQLNAVNNKDEIIDVNQSCNYGLIQLGLDSDLLLEFKRSVSDRLDSKINIYLDEFSNKKTANLEVYFGITKIIDEYKNSRKIKQNDLIEPQQIKLTDLKFNAKFKNGEKLYSYDDLIVYDRLTNDSKPISVVIVRGKIQIGNIIETKNGTNLLVKYELFCETCDMKSLVSYFDVEELEMNNPNWYINTKHPSELYLSNQFIKTKLKIQNSNKALEGRQELKFAGETTGEYDIAIDQKYSGFAPYLNYNEDYKNIYLENSFNIKVNAENVIKQLMQNANIKEETKKDVIEEKPKEIIKKEAPKKPKVKPKKPNSIQLDIAS